jgi:mRNA-degrading endonuclease RelE of RelBE toxin-antitoxin system
MSCEVELSAAEQLQKIDQMFSKLIADRIKTLVAAYGSYRIMGKALHIDHAYLHRLATGEKINPGKVLLRKIGLER